MKKQVRFEYERSVRWGAEQATLHDAVYTMGLVSGDSRLSTLYRKIYGSANTKALENLRQVMSAPSYSNKAMLLTDSAVRIPTGLSETLHLGHSANIEERSLDKELEPLQGKRVLTPADMSLLCNDLSIAGQLPVAMKLSEGETFTDELFTPDDKGKYRTYKNAAGATVTVESLVKQAIGAVPSFLTPADVTALSQASDFAQELGISLEDAAVLAKPRDDLTDAISFSLRADWLANDLTFGENTGQDEGGDWLRFNAERPGGRNYDSGVSDDRQQGIVDQVGLTAAGRGITGDSALSIRRQTVELAKRRNPALAQSLEYDMRRPDADIQKKDSHAVLRIASGFHPQWGNIYANKDKFKTLFQSNRFLIQAHNESRAERMSLVETFGPSYLYLFGERPNVWNYSGILLDTQGLNWLNEWRAAWKSITGGTRTAKAKARAFLIYRDVVREGILVASSESASINEFGYAMFSFSMFVIKEHFLSGDPKPGQTSPEVQATPQAGQAESVKQNYDYSFLDATEDARTRFLSSLEKGQKVSSNQVFAIEDNLTLRRKAEIEEGIVGQAFEGGMLAAYTGSVKLPLQTAQAQQAVAFSVRLQSEADMTPTAEVVG